MSLVKDRALSLRWWKGVGLRLKDLGRNWVWLEAAYGGPAGSRSLQTLKSRGSVPNLRTALRVADVLRTSVDRILKRADYGDYDL